MKDLRLYTLLLFTLCTIHYALCATQYSLRYYDDRNGLSHHRSSGVIEDSSGMIWISTWNGINRFDGSSFTTFKPQVGDGVSMPCDRIRRIRLLPGDSILCRIEDRVLVFDTHTGRFDTLTHAIEEEYMQEMRQPLRSTYDFTPRHTKTVQVGNRSVPNIRTQFTDSKGNIWLLEEYGIYVASPVVEPGEVVNTIEARHVHRMKNGDIWCYERDTRHLQVYDSQLHLRGYLGRDLRLHPQPVDFAPVYKVLEGQNGHIWLGCKPGNMLEIANGRITEHPNTPSVYDMYESSEGHIWCASFAHGLLQIIDGHIIHHTPDMYMRDLCVINDTTLVGATTDGLLIVDNIHDSHPAMRMHQRDPLRKNSLSSNAVMSSTWHNGRLYIATEGGGINLLTTDDLQSSSFGFQHITKEHGLGSDVVYNFTSLTDTTLLIQGNSWLALLNSKSHIPTLYNHSFFHRHLIFSEITPILLDSGTLLLAPKEGLMRLPVASLTRPEPFVRVALSAIKRQDRMDYAVDYLDHIQLSKEERSVAICFSAVEYDNDRHILYSTRLYHSGEKPGAWSSPTVTNEVILQDLRPGNYIFEVRATNASGHWIDNTRSLRIDVTPTFRETTAGVVLIALMLLAIVLTITILTLRMRFMRQRRQQTLQAYLELQERLSAIEQQQEQSAAGHEPLPVPEVLAPGIPSKDEQFLNQVRQFMEANMGNCDAVIDDLAEATNMSRSTLNRKMHELFNLSAKDFLQEARIKHACQLLRTTDLASKEVAFACGFSDPRYFAKCFKSSVGKTPTEFRQS